MSDTDQQRRQRVITILNRRLDERSAELGTLEEQYTQLRAKFESKSDEETTFSTQKEALEAKKDGLDEEAIRLEEEIKEQQKTLDETLQYVYGAAEVMGLYMVNVLDIDKKAYLFSRYLGRALQCINAIRDIAEDNEFGRSYIPKTDLDYYELESLEYSYTRQHPKRFSDFIKGQISRYYHWQEIAEKGYQFVPKRYLICVKTVSDMYNWTAEQILKNPFIVYSQKVKPLIIQVLSAVFKNIIYPIPKKSSILHSYIKPVPQIQSMKM